MKAIVIAGAVLAVGGALYTVLANPPFWVETQIRKSMESYALDPDSLKFSDLKYSDKNRDYICGYVNGTNALGGYAGRTRFAYSTKIKEFYMMATRFHHNMRSSSPGASTRLSDLLRWLHHSAQPI